MPFPQFLADVYALASGVLDGALPPPEKTPGGLSGASGREALDAASAAGGGPGLVGPEEFDVPVPKRGGSVQGVEIRVLSSSSSSGGASGGAPGTPTRRR